MKPVSIRRVILLSIAIVLFIPLAVSNGRLYTAVPPPGQIAPEVIDQLRYLRRALDEGAATDMQALFPEGYFFSHVLYGLAWVDVGLQSPADSLTHRQALAEARWAWQHLDDRSATAVFSPTLDPPYGMFYAGWRNYLLAGILLLQHPDSPDADEMSIFQVQSEIIAAAIERSPTPFLPSYPTQAWPVDTFPAIVSLGVYSVLVDDRYESLIDNWLSHVRERLDPETGLVPHRTDFQTGDMREGARATSQTLILRFLVDIDPELAQSYYETFRQTYLVRRLGLPGVLEYPPFRPGTGDIDSGPLVFGVSLSATAVFLGTSRLYGDTNLATPLWQGGEALGMAIDTGKERRYALGLMPIGDAFMVWSKTAVSWLDVPLSPSFTPLMPWWWRWPLHLLSLGTAVLVGLLLRRLWR